MHNWLFQGSTRKRALTINLVALLCVLPTIAYPQQTSEDQASVAREWTEALLSAIRSDRARPTVHARNLYHLSVAMFDAWASYETTATPVFTHLQSTQPDCQAVAEIETEQPYDLIHQKQAIGYAAWTLLNHRFSDNPRSVLMLQYFRELAVTQGLDENKLTQTQTDDAADIGVSVGRCVIAMGLQDASNEQNDYANLDYAPINPPLNPELSGNPGVQNPNRWQPLELGVFIDQSGIVSDTPEFLSADWGGVTPFALRSTDRTDITIDGVSVPVWHDPGYPPLLGDDAQANQVFQRNHLMVALWSAHLDPQSGQTIDISPGAMGNLAALDTLPDEQSLILEEYDQLNGGLFNGSGHAINPHTAAAYPANEVPLGDYTRVLAEFWADGPDSETPPGHWYAIYNETVAGYADHKRRLAGNGDELSPLAYDVVAYLALGGALHDSAIAAWSTKRAYDYVRPISAIRYMATLGQSSDPDSLSYHPQGVPLIPGRVELVTTGDPLAGTNNTHVGKVKALVWRGPDAIANPDTDTAGVGWQLLEQWWPYQRPTFVTPPFAGYVSGHSTFSRAAAEVLTALTGDAFFPGGYAEFTARQNEFLVFEEGPSVDVKLQWATYRDAADQTSLSRIWGGIHPPADDLVGRKMGEKIGINAWLQAAAQVAETYPDALSGLVLPPARSIDDSTDDGAGSGSGGGGSTDKIMLLFLLSGLILWPRSNRHEI